MADFRKLTTAVIVDTETTGFDPKVDRVISLALAKVNFGTSREDRSGKLNVSYELADYVFDPEIPIPAGATRVHGFTDEMVKGKPKFADHAREIRDFIGDLPLVAHNVKFDGPMLDAEFKRAGVETIPTKRGHRWCTMMEAHRRACLIFGEDVKWPKLTEAAPYAGVKFAQAQTHDATEDVLNTLKLVLGFRNTRVRNGQLEEYREVASYAPRPPSRTAISSNYKPAWPEETRAPKRNETREGTHTGWMIGMAIVVILVLVVAFGSS